MKPSPYEQSLVAGQRNALAAIPEFTESERAEIKQYARVAVYEIIGEDIIYRRTWPWWRRLMSNFR